MSIINPKKAFVWGCDYRVPVMHGLLDKQFIQELKMSPTYQEETFAREYKADMYSLNYWELLETSKAFITTT